jgi:peptidoglycan/LPS O-acetylase OafA/YrhL
MSTDVKSPPLSHAAARTEQTEAGNRSIAGLDAVRFCAAILVLFYHLTFFSWNEPISELGGRAAIGWPVSFPELTPLTSWGWVGVETFFVISGLIIPLSAEGQSAVQFLRGRILRLVPALWFFATVSLLVTFLYSRIDAAQALFLFAKSLVLFPRGPWIDGVYWTLTIEVIFYAVFLIAIIARQIQYLQTFAYIASALVFCFYFLVVVALVWPPIPYGLELIAIATAYVSRVALLTTGAYFLVGLILYLSFKEGLDRARLAALSAALFAGCVGIWLNAAGSPGVLAYNQSAFVPVIAWLVLVGLIVASLFTHSRGMRFRPEARTLLRTLGLATYPIYLLHNIAGAYLFGLMLKAGAEQFGALIFTIVMCVLASIIFATWVEPNLRRSLSSCFNIVSGHLAVCRGVLHRRWSGRREGKIVTS